MSTAQQLRALIETQLASRIPSALTPEPRDSAKKLATGIAEIDRITGGGFPLGAITELAGPPSSGRTTLAMSLVSNVTGSGNVAAWIDAGDAFDAESASAMGVALPQVLLVRCGLSCAPQAAEGINVPVQIPLLVSPGERSRTKPGTPGAGNRKLGKVDRAEQATSDRMPARRGQQILEGRSEASRTTSRGKTATDNMGLIHSPGKGIEQSVRVADILMQHGGFQAVVLDLGGIGPELAGRIPSATWFRLRALAELHHCCLLLLAPCASARSAAALSLELSLALAADDATVLQGISYRALVTRHRFAVASDDSVEQIGHVRKPPQSVRSGSWHAVASWSIPR